MNCPNYEDYSPCVCPYIKWLGNEYMLSCHGFPADQIKTALLQRKTPADFGQLYVSVTPTVLINSTFVAIPEDFFGNHRCTYMLAIFSDLNLQFHKSRLTVNPGAFRASRNSVICFLIWDFDLTDLKFSFLIGFNNLKDLNITESHLPGLLDFPSLPNLEQLSIIDCTGLNMLSININCSVFLENTKVNTCMEGKHALLKKFCRQSISKLCKLIKYLWKS